MAGRWVNERILDGDWFLKGLVRGVSWDMR